MSHANLRLPTALALGTFLALSGPASGAEQPPLEDVQRSLQERADELGLTLSDLSEVVVSDSYFSEHNGMLHLYLQQHHAGIPVHNALINLNIDRDGRIVHLGNRFVPNLAAAARSADPRLSGRDAVEATLRHLGLAATEPLIEERTLSARELVFSDAGVSLEPIPAKLVYLPDEERRVRLVWTVDVYTLDAQHYWVVFVDAETGQVVRREDRVVQDSWAPTDTSGEVGFLEVARRSGGRSDAAAASGTGQASTGPISSILDGSAYRVYPVPVESPSHAGDPSMDLRSLVVDPADPTASPLGWHDTDTTQFTVTRGNNVHAYTDVDANGVPDPGSDPDGGTDLEFDFPVDFSMEPDTYRPAAVTNLFYWNNVIHDIAYRYGFDEAAGNFQVNNFGLGGLGDDDVRAEAQDGAGVNNANFLTPPDGLRPRMQMFLFNLGDPNRDGDFDNGVIVHEYTHGISNRLTGGPSNVGCLVNNEHMGEGWSDYFALLLTDTDVDHRGMGTYVLFQPTDGGGIRPFPYNPDFAVNAVTYGDLPGFSVPHGVGFVWATMLWDMTRALVDRHGFDPDIPTGTGGNNFALQLVMDGMKLQPCSPGFVDGRDAVLAADAILTEGLNQCLIWDAFANRGLGFSADQGSPNSTQDGTEAFDLPLSCCTFAILESKVIALRDSDVLNPDQADSLLGKLDAAQAAIAEGRIDAAIDFVQAFIDQVLDLVADGVLTPAQGDDLTDCAEGAIARTEEDFFFSPVALEVDAEAGDLADGNAVFEPGERVEMAPAWRNDGTFSRVLAGQTSDFTGPSGPDYTPVVIEADYGELASTEVVSCRATGTCYELEIGPPGVSRPATHWDAGVDETLSDTAGTAKTWTLHIGDSFTDVPRSNLFYTGIETLLHSGVTGGCDDGEYCPGDANSRSQMPAFMLRALEGPGYSPQACLEGEARLFDDVPASNLFCPWIEDLTDRGIVSGCGGGNYCPGAAVTRAQMAIFLLKTLEGSDYTPDACGGQFDDVPCPSLFAAWIEDLAARGITGGCTATDYCPADAVTRAQMAVFITRAFGFTLYGP